MIILYILFVLTVLGAINCFQWAASILAKQTGRSSKLWFWISLFLPGISMIILIWLWDREKPKV